MNINILDRSGLTGIGAMMISSQHCWTGDVIQIDSTHIPCQPLCRVLMQGRRNHKCWRGNTRPASESVKHIGIPKKSLNLGSWTEESDILWQREPASILSIADEIELLLPKKEEWSHFCSKYEIQNPSSVTYSLNVCLQRQTRWSHLSSKIEITQ